MVSGDAGRICIPPAGPPDSIIAWGDGAREGDRDGDRDRDRDREGDLSPRLFLIGRKMTSSPRGPEPNTYPARTMDGLNGLGSWMVRDGGGDRRVVAVLCRRSALVAAAAKGVVVVDADDDATDDDIDAAPGNGNDTIDRSSSDPTMRGCWRPPPLLMTLKLPVLVLVLSTCACCDAFSISRLFRSNSRIIASKLHWGHGRNSPCRSRACAS